MWTRKRALHDKLVEGREMAYISRTLAKIVRNADITCDLQNCGVYRLDGDVKQFLEVLQFRSLISRLNFETPSTQSVQTETEQITEKERLIQVVQLLSRCDKVAFHYDGERVYLSGSAEKDYEVKNR